MEERGHGLMTSPSFQKTIDVLKGLEKIQWPLKGLNVEETAQKLSMILEIILSTLREKKSKLLD